MRKTTFLGMFLGLSLAGCGDDGGDSGGGVEVGDTTSVAITAAEGGEVALGEATLMIPAGALADDTTITVTVMDADAQPDAENIRGHVYDFGPDGLELLEPATLEIGISGNVPEGKVAAIGYLDGDSWRFLSDSAAGNGKVTATTTHFTPFTVVITSEGQLLGRCDTVTPCGGELEGTWTFTGSCVTLSSDAIYPDCVGATGSATLDLTGTITFAAGGTYAVEGSQELIASVRIPLSCVTSGDCGDLSDTSRTFVERDGACEAEWADTEALEDAGVWSTSGTELTIDDDVLDYCVSGDTAQLRRVDPDNGAVWGYEAQRQ